MTRIYGKNQVVLPKSAREALGLKVGDDLVVEVRGHEIVMRKPQGIFDFKPPHPRRNVGLNDRQTTDAAWDEHIAEKHAPGSQR